MHDSLWPNIHVRPRSHLTILSNSQRIEFLPIIWLRVIWDHHTIRNHYARGVFVRREQTERMSAVHHERLFFGHLREVLHHQSVLCPVLENTSVSTVSDQLLRVLCYSGIEVVLDHQHDRCSLLRFGWVPIDRTCLHFVGWTEAIHVDPSIVLEFLCKLFREFSMHFLWKVAQAVADG